MDAFHQLPVGWKIGIGAFIALVSLEIVLRITIAITRDDRDSDKIDE